MKFHHIALIGRRRTPEAAASVLTLAAFLRDQGATVYLDNEAISAAESKDFLRIDREVISTHVELAIVIGGDGTLLGIARQLAGSDVPLVGINHGRLGFMTDIPLADMLDSIAKIAQGHYQAEQRPLLEAEVIRASVVVAQGTAFNDIVFSRGALGAMIEFEIFVDNQFVYTQRSDGLIVSPPTGSTAYALAAGGPIIHPTVPAIALVPICPQSMTNRPIIVHDRCEVKFILLRGVESRVHFDGQSTVDLKSKDIVVIRRGPHLLTLLHPIAYDYYKVLRQKLHWGEQLL